MEKHSQEPENTNEPRALFIAPVDMQAGDEIVLLLNRLALIRRQGVVIWRDPDLPDYLVELLEQEP